MFLTNQQKSNNPQTLAHMNENDSTVVPVTIMAYSFNISTGILKKLKRRQ